MKVVIVTTQLMLPVILAGGICGPLQRLLDSSDAVFIGNISRASDNSGDAANLTVIRAIKGALQPGAVINARLWPKNVRGADIVRGASGAALLFANQASPGVWELSSLGLDIGLGAPYVPLAIAEPERIFDQIAGSAHDRLVRLLAVAVEADPKRAGLDFLALMSPGESLAGQIYRNWADSSVAALRAYGLSALISAGDVPALVRAASEVEALGKSRDGERVSSSISGFIKTDVEAVHALGRIVTAPAATPGFRSAAALALSRIHTKHTLRYLYELLSSPDPIVRQDAIRGFSAFTTNMRIAQTGLDSSEALDEVLNPGRKRTLPSPEAPYDTPGTRQYLHFGPFRDASEEAAYLQFWKGWFERRRSELEQ
jgi:hypothetical protein